MNVSTKLLSPPKKKRKTSHVALIVFGHMRTEHGKEPNPISLKILLDSGASALLIKGQLVEKLTVTSDQTTRWSTAAGPLNTTERCDIQFSLPELSPTRLVKWSVHVDATNKLPYDMIMGRDALHELGINLNFKEQTVQWDEAEIPMHDVEHTYADAYHLQQDSTSVADATERIQRILDAKYEPADLKEIAEWCDHLNKSQQKQLYELLRRYEDLFDGTLGHWKDSQYDVELQPNASPFHARPYPIPHKYENT